MNFDEISEALDELDSDALRQNLEARARNTLSELVISGLKKQGVNEDPKGLAQAWCLIYWTPELFELVLSRLIRDLSNSTPDIIMNILIEQNQGEIQ